MKAAGAKTRSKVGCAAPFFMVGWEWRTVRPSWTLHVSLCLYVCVCLCVCMFVWLCVMEFDGGRTVEGLVLGTVPEGEASTDRTAC